MKIAPPRQLTRLNYRSREPRHRWFLAPLMIGCLTLACFGCWLLRSSLRTSPRPSPDYMRRLQLFQIHQYLRQYAYIHAGVFPNCMSCADQDCDPHLFLDPEDPIYVLSSSQLRSIPFDRRCSYGYVPNLNEGDAPGAVIVFEKASPARGKLLAITIGGNLVPWPVAARLTGVVPAGRPTSNRLANYPTTSGTR